MIELFSREVPGQLGKKIVNILNDGFMFAYLSHPNSVQICHCEGLRFDREPDDLFQLFHILQQNSTRFNRNSIGQLKSYYYSFLTYFFQ